jgi:acetyl esterase
MPVDSELLPILGALNGMPRLQDVPLHFIREAAPPLPTGAPVEMARVTNRTIETPDGDLPVRIYHPEVSTLPLPVLVYYHGGGWVLGNLDSHDSVVRALAASAGCIVVSVGYRLAPEHRFPAAVHDCVSAALWVHANAMAFGADPHRIAVGGDSAGGNLATVVALTARDSGGPALVGQLLVYPATRLCGPRCGSLAANSEGYFLRTSDMDWFENHYLGDSRHATDSRASPLLAEDLGRLPPALVITAEFDPLCDQGEAYARRLSEAGTLCTLTRYAGAIHGFFGMPVAIGDRAVAQAGAWLKGIFANCTHAINA